MSGCPGWKKTKSTGAFALQVMRDFCAEGAKKLGWHKVAFTGKSFPKADEQANRNMLAEVFEAVWCAATLRLLSAS